MATIYKRNNSFCVIYYLKGVRKQKWETFQDYESALRRKREVELCLENDYQISPKITTINELIDEFLEMYGKNKWAYSTYDSQRTLINNYVRPFIGNAKIEDVSTRFFNRYFEKLRSVETVYNKYNPSKSGSVSNSTIHRVFKSLRCIFNQAVKWDVIEKNPVSYCTLPSVVNEPRKIWSENTLNTALSKCNNYTLKLAINLAFSCSLRIGELLGLTWDCVNISAEDIRNNSAYVYVEKELQRVSKESLSKIGEISIYKKFPPIYPKNTTVLVLKTPKTKSSVRTVYLPKSVAEMLVEYKEYQEKQKNEYGDEYQENYLVFCVENGRPMESSVLSKMFKDFIKQNDLPDVVFHSLRHTSASYKLKLSGGDIKSVQGDTGHSQASMVTDLYAHIMDVDRRNNAQRMERSFYCNETNMLDDCEISDDILKLASILAKSPDVIKLIRQM